MFYTHLMEWVFVTATFGSDDFLASGRRILSQARKMNLFSDYILVNDTNLKDYAPVISQKYKNYLNSKTTGYGYYSWKPEIIFRLLQLHPSKGICYVDAGCEINHNFIALCRFKLWQGKAAKVGYLVHELNYPESTYTKKEVLNKLSAGQIGRAHV